jgi:hypothetical protein
MDPKTNLTELTEEDLAREIVTERNLPYTLKIERVDGSKISCRSSWGNHIFYVFKEGKFLLEAEL